MSLLRRVMVPEFRWGLANPPELAWDGLAGGRTVSGVTMNEASALSLDAVWACVALLARSIGSMPLIVYRGVGKARERAENTSQWGLLHVLPNSMWQPDSFIEDIMTCENLWGNWFAEKVKAGSGARTVVGELWRIPPRCVRVECDKNGEKRFLLENDSTRSYTSADILHIPGFGYDGRTGLSPIQIHREGLANEASRDEWSARLYGNSANPSGVLEVDGKLTDDAATRLQSRWQQAHGGLRNFGKTAVLEGGVKWRQIGIPQRDQQYIEQARFGVNRVARIFQVPPEKIGGDRPSSMTYASVDAANQDFVIYSLQHWMVRLEQGFKHDPDLFPEAQGLYPEFLAEGLLRGDAKSRADFYTAMNAMRALTVNEIRMRENMPPLPGGDEFPEPPEPPAAVEPDVQGRQLVLDLAPRHGNGNGDGHAEDLVRREDFLAESIFELAAAHRDQKPPVANVTVEQPAVTVEAAQIHVTPEIRAELTVAKREMTVRREVSDDGSSVTYKEED